MRPKTSNHNYNTFLGPKFYTHARGSENFKFTRPTPERVYVKLLKFIADHPMLTRKEINFAILGKGKNAKYWTSRNARGNHCLLWSNLLDGDYISCTKDFLYYIRPLGANLLSKAYNKNVSLTYRLGDVICKFEN